jgi:hypothetical protein
VVSDAGAGLYGDRPPFAAQVVPALSVYCLRQKYICAPAVSAFAQKRTLYFFAQSIGMYLLSYTYDDAPLAEAKTLKPSGAVVSVIIEKALPPLDEYADGFSNHGS